MNYGNFFALPAFWSPLASLLVLLSSYSASKYAKANSHHVMNLACKVSQTAKSEQEIL